MSDQDDLTRVEAFVTTLIARLKSEVGGELKESNSAFFTNGVNLISMKVTNGRANAELVISGNAPCVPQSSGPKSDRVVQPMFIELPSTLNTGIEAINVEVQIVFANGQTETRTLTNLPSGKTFVNI